MRARPEPSPARSCGAGAIAGFALVLGAAAAHLPLRIASAGVRAGYGARFADHLLGGLCSDLAVLLPWLALGWAALAGLVVRRSGPTTTGFVVALALPGLLLLSIAAAGIGAAEFQMQRGLWPTAWDAGAVDAGFLFAALRLVLGGAHTLAFAASLAVVGGALLLLAAALRRVRGSSRPAPFIVASLCALLLVFAVCRIGFLNAARGLFPTVHDRDSDLRSPLRHFVGSIRLQQDTRNNLRLAAGGQLRRSAFTAADMRAGAALLGLPLHAEVGRGPTEAFRRELPDREPGATELTMLCRDLSHAAFADSALSPSVLAISLEAVRAADVNALAAGAPREITPFLNALYGQGHGLPARAVGASQAYQGGQRTSHALAAAACGLGALPFGWSAARDFGKLSARCLPDLLADAGYRGGFTTGASLAFDAMETFFRSHAVVPVGEESFPPGAPKAAWGRTDRALFRLVRELLLAQPPGPRWDLVLTLTNHGPEKAPPDLPPAVRRRVDGAIAPFRPAPSAQVRERLLTVSYTDAALEEFLRGWVSSPRGGETIVVVHADHAVNDRSPWDAARVDPARSFDAGAARIPLVIIIPESLVAGSADPAATAAALGRLAAWLGEHPVSINDLPGIELALLSEAAPLRALPAGLRWHTLGGQATSPWQRPPGGAPGSIWGIDGFSRLFVLDAAGRPLARREAVLPVSSPRSIETSDSPLKPAAAVIRRFLETAEAPAGGRTQGRVNGRPVAPGNARTRGNSMGARTSWVRTRTAAAAS